MWRVLRVFFDDPNPSGAGLQLREISRKAEIAPTSVKNYLNELTDDKKHGYPLVIKSKHRIYKYPVYWANRASDLFRYYKKLDMIDRIKNSGLLDYLYDKCTPDVIILLGSASHGEDLKESDIDIFLQCNDRKLDLSKFEEALNRKISLFFASDFMKLSSELKNNIMNGIILKGRLDVF